MMRALGARPETLVGLSGLGDLTLSCSTPQSRNFAAGLALGRGEPPQPTRLSASTAARGATTERDSLRVTMVMSTSAGSARHQDAG